MKAIGVVAASVFSAVMIFYAGVFATSFKLNMCYSEALSRLGSAAENVARTEDKVEFKRWAAWVKNIPAYGYESSCHDIQAYLDAPVPPAK